MQRRFLGRHLVQSDPGNHLQGKGESTQQEEQGSVEQGVVVRGRGSFRKGNDFWQGWEGVDAIALNCLLPNVGLKRLGKKD